MPDKQLISHDNIIMWPDQAEWVGCWEYWFIDTSNYCMQFLLYNIILSCKYFTVTVKSYRHGGFGIWKSYVSSKIFTTVSKTHLDWGWYVTHSAWSGHMCAFEIECYVLSYPILQMVWMHSSHSIHVAVLLKLVYKIVHQSK